MHKDQNDNANGIKEAAGKSKMITVTLSDVAPNAIPDVKPKQNREKGRIQAIVDSIKNEPGFFYSYEYVAKFPPATVQGILSVLKAYGVIMSVAGETVDANGNRRVERGKYIRTELIEKNAMAKEIEMLKNEVNELRSLL